MNKKLSILRKKLSSFLSSFLINILFIKEARAMPTIKYAPAPPVPIPMYGIPPPHPIIIYIKIAAIIIAPIVVLASLVFGILWYLKKISKKTFVIILGIIWLIFILIFVMYKILFNRLGY